MALAQNRVPNRVGVKTTPISMASVCEVQHGDCLIRGPVRSVLQMVELLTRHEPRPVAPVRLGPGGEYVTEWPKEERR